MFCPECGLDARDAKFCPECGNDLNAIRDVLGVEEFAESEELDERPEPRRAPRAAARTTGQAASRRTGNGGRGARPAATRASSSRASAARPGAGRAPSGRASRLSPALIWGIAGVLMVAVVAVVIVLGSNGAGADAATGSGAPQTTGPVAADTSGSYRELVARANGLYDQGAQAFQKDDSSGGAQYFAAAATVYGAAWEKQAGDPNVGTDYATSLFYSGDTDAALVQVEAVLAKSPDFQTAYLNKGIFLQSSSQEADTAGQSDEAKKLLDQARAAFEKAVAISPASDPGKKAADILESL